MIATPLISIIIPCYNQAEFLDETLQSVLNQTYANWECIIVNDGSTDNSEIIAKKWVAKDKRFKYYYKQNSGVSSTRNFALDKVKGTYVQFLDADDVINNKKLELSLLETSTLKDDKIVISNFRMFSINQEHTTKPYCNLNSDLFTYDNLLYKWNETFSIPIHCGFFKASLFKEIRFPENLTAQEDWIVWVKLFKLNPNVIFLDQPLALYRQNLRGRTKTKSLHDDQIKAYAYLKGLLSEDEFYKLSTTLISRYYKSEEEIKKRLRKVKASRPYQTGLMIKKILKKIGLLKISRRIFPILLKFKAKN
ncbi:glycosyltransferase family 2 protein [Seonamhaeicola sp. NFXS20]|uniref:glycosyltransferase family 2 protein n=1 Tax=Seonamhaeicola sp. NFXS20 TaxID=2816959 RepID=UPI003B8D584C